MCRLIYPRSLQEFPEESSEEFVIYGILEEILKEVAERIGIILFDTTPRGNPGTLPEGVLNSWKKLFGKIVEEYFKEFLEQFLKTSSQEFHQKSQNILLEFLDAFLLEEFLKISMDRFFGNIFRGASSKGFWKCLLRDLWRTY